MDCGLTSPTEAPCLRQAANTSEGAVNGSAAGKRLMLAVEADKSVE